MQRKNRKGIIIDYLDKKGLAFNLGKISQKYEVVRKINLVNMNPEDIQIIKIQSDSNEVHLTVEQDKNSYS